MVVTGSTRTGSISNADGAMGLATLLRPYVLAACGSACVPAGKPPALAPHNVRRPALRGMPVVGQLLTCQAGVMDGYEAHRLLLPLASQRQGARRAPRQLEERLGAADRGRLVACRIWAGNSKGATQATSNGLRVRSAP